MAETIRFWLLSFVGSMAFLLSLRVQEVDTFIVYAVLFACCTATVTVMAVK